MKAVVLTRYGPPEGLVVQDLDVPTLLPGEILVRVHATTVTAGDAELRASNVPWLFRLPLRIWMGLFRPRPGTVLGMEVAGVVEQLGEGVDRFAVGDAVFGATGMGFGSYAELVRLKADGIVVHKPAAVPFGVAAPAPVAGLAALGYLRKGAVATGKSVLIRGASGSIGTYAVQLAKQQGAHVTGVCPPQGVERVRALGADVVIDYTEQDFVQEGVAYDVVVDVVGKLPISRCLRAVKPGGAYVRGTVPGLWEVLVALWARVASRKRVVLGDAGESVHDLVTLAALLESGALETVIARRFGLDQIVDAHRFVDAGHKQGSVVVEVTRADP